jgi:hypothetical protein
MSSLSNRRFLEITNNEVNLLRNIRVSKQAVLVKYQQVLSRKLRSFVLLGYNRKLQHLKIKREGGEWVKELILCLVSQKLAINPFGADPVSNTVADLDSFNFLQAKTFTLPRLNYFCCWGFMVVHHTATFLDELKVCF